MTNTIQIRRGANTSLPTLSAAEFGFSTDTKQIYIGDGVDNHEIAKVAWVSDNFNNYIHPNHTGDVTSSGDGVQTIANDTVTISHLSASGTPNETSFLRGDNTWATPSGSGNVATDGNPIDNDFAKFVNGTDIEGRSYAEVRSDLNIADGANNYSHPNHTGDVISSGDGAQSIADNAVTLAKMAGGTDGNLITYDADGDPAYVSTGISAQVLTSNGPGTAPTFQNATGGDPVLIKFSLEASDSFTIPDNYQYIVHDLEIGNGNILIENGGQLVIL